MKQEITPARSANAFNSDPVIRQPRLRPVPLLAECDVCGSPDLDEVKCKVICRNCRTILQSCADL